MNTSGLDRLNADLRATPGGRLGLERARLWAEATENLCRLMETEGVTQAELARRLDISPVTVNQMLGGDRNFTLGTLSAAFFVLGRSMHVTYGPITSRVEIVKERPAIGSKRRARAQPARTRRGKPSG